MVEHDENTPESSVGDTLEAPAAQQPRRRRSATRPAGPPAVAEHPAEPELEQSLEAEDVVPEDVAEPVDAPDDEAPEGEEEVEEAPAAPEAPEAPEVPEAQPADQSVTAPARRPRRATRGVTTIAFSAEPPAQPVVAAIPPVEATAVALFQPPDETKAVRTRRRSRAAAPAGPAEGAATSDAADSAVAATEAAGVAEGTGAAEEATPAGEHLAPVDLAEALDETAGTRDTEAEDTSDAAGEDRDDEGAPRRRRRRGGRRRRRSGPGGGDAEVGELAEGEEADEGWTGEATASDEEPPGAGADEAPEGSAGGSGEAAEEEPSGSRRRRRRRRRAGVAEEMEDLSLDDAEKTVVKVREGRRREGSDEITSVRGSTRIEAKKQRRRDGREAGRRRAPILTEAEFLARRESVNRVMCVRERGDLTQIAVLEDGILVEHYVSRSQSASMIGNVYLGKVQNVLPSMEAAFVDIGRGRNAVLYAGEVNWEAAGLEGQPKRIELALKSGDPVLVQVTKDPIGHKGARLTSQISLPGRFLVYVPEGSMTGISRKLPDTERARLKGILKDVVPDGAGVIVRTAAEGATEEQLTADVRRLTAQWGEITKKAKSASPPTLLYGEPDLVIKVVRDIFNEDFTTLLVEGESTWTTLSDYIGWVAPDLLHKLQKWVEPTDLYTAHRIDEQLAKALDRKVWLPSGGSLVIDRTEAMTVVDVNTGKFTGQGGNLEETVTRNNLEAAEEIVRQLRLRDIGGIVVIDFIDMVLESNRDLVLRRLVECLGRDRTKHQVAEVTSLGLVQMTRKRIGQGLLEVFSTACEACGGRGHVVHSDPVGSGQSQDEPNGRRERDRGRRSQRPVPPVNLGGKQTGKVPPPPRFDEHGHINHSADSEAGLEAAEAVPAPEVPEAATDVPEVAVETAPAPEAEPTAPEAVEPEGVEPEGVEPEGVEPEGVEPEGVEPEGVEPESAEPADEPGAPEHHAPEHDPGHEPAPEHDPGHEHEPAPDPGHPEAV